MEKNIEKEVMLTYFDIKANSNKFYHIKLMSNNVVKAEYGRIKDSKSIRYEDKGQIGENGYKKLLNSKLKKGYQVADILLENVDSKISSSNKFDLLELAMSQIQTNNQKCKELVQRLVDKNIHNITTSTNISFNKSTGLFTTALGPVTQEGLNKAHNKLIEIEKYIKKYKIDSLNFETKEFLSLNEEYFLIIPTDIKNLREIKSYMLFTEERLKKQFDICETLVKTLELIKIDNSDKKNEKTIQEEVFKVKMELLEDKKEIKRINEMFEKSKNSQHGYSVNSLKIENIYSISLNDEEKVFRKDMKNIMELFHGTKVVNILSILKSGLLMPKETPGRTTGAMFGHGLYFSDQSTKSLNYCDGMYWNNSAKQDKIYLFIADIAMGNYQIPSGPTLSKPKAGYDSYFAKSSESGVRNNEMIIFNKNQIKLKYILEIKA